MPTLWFWNDPEHQRLLAPVGLLAIPLCVLLNAIQMWLRLDAWVSIFGCLAMSVLAQGFVERTIRRQLRLPVRSVDRLPVEPFMLLAGAAAVAAIVVSALAWGAAMALFTALVLALVTGVTAATAVLSTRTTTLACAALAFFCASMAAFAAFGLPGLAASLGVLALSVSLAVAVHRRRHPGVRDAGARASLPESQRLEDPSRRSTSTPARATAGRDAVPVSSDIF